MTKIRAEHLQDISDNDILHEGIEYSHRGGYYVNFDKITGSRDWLGRNNREAFSKLIDKTCGKGTWDWNPLVWVYEFELIK